MTLIGDEDFGVTNLFTQFYFSDFYDSTGTFLKIVRGIGHFSFFGIRGSFCKHCHGHFYLKRPLTAHSSITGRHGYFPKCSPGPIRFQGQLSQKLPRVVQELPPGKKLMQCGVQ